MSSHPQVLHSAGKETQARTTGQTTLRAVCVLACPSGGRTLSAHLQIPTNQHRHCWGATTKSVSRRVSSKSHQNTYATVA